MTVGVLGGTFDPIHLGHIAAATAAQDALRLDQIILIPSRLPPHRDQPTNAAADDRLRMAELAAEARPGWSVSRMEIDRDGKSYTYDTLIDLRQTLSLRLGTPVDASQIFFITGADAFAEIATWSRYPAVLDLANFVVVSRPGITLDSLRERVPSAFTRTTLRASDSQPAPTRVILVEARTPDVSSTEIRRRVRAGQSLSGLVPDRVADYIAARRLYGSHPTRPVAQN